MYGERMHSLRTQIDALESVSIIFCIYIGDGVWILYD